MNNIPNDVLEEIILSKVKLFTKESYYRYFRSILLELYKNIHAFQSRTSLISRLKSKLKEKNNSSLWQIILILIFPSKNSKYIEEKYIQYDPFLNPLCFQYLKNLCRNRMKKLTNLANIERVSIDQVITLYINLCEKHIYIKKEPKKATIRLIGNFLRMNLDRKASALFPKTNPILPRAQLKLSLKKIMGKNSPSIQPLEYANSFTRLFIGETDEVSVRERYLSNMVVKKQRQLHLVNSYGDFSFLYLKKMYKKLFKGEGTKGKMDNDMISILKQFENDHKRIDNFQRNIMETAKHNYLNDINDNYSPFQFDKIKEHIKNNFRKKNFKSRTTKFKLRSKSVLGSTEMFKKNHEISYKLINKTKYINKYNLMDSKKNKINDELILNKRMINSYGNNKILDIKKNNFIYRRNKNKNISTYIEKDKYKSHSVDTKTNFIKNYMNKSDFFFL